MQNKRFLALAGLTLLVLSDHAYAGGAGCYGSQCYQRIDTPPTYGTVSRQVMVSPGGVQRHVTPAEYGSVNETVVVQPARTVARHVPAVTSTVAERVMVAPASRRWQVTRDAYGREVGCWVDVPAQYGVQHRTVVVRPSAVAYDTIPEVTATRTRSVMTRPAQVHETVIPPTYSTQHQTVMTSPGGSYWQPMR